MAHFYFQDCCLIVYHPYRPLLQYVQDMGQEDMLLPLAWLDAAHLSQYSV